MNTFVVSNRVLAVVIAAFSVGYLVLVSGLPDFVSVNVPVQPATVPRWLGVGLLLLAVVLFFTTDAESEAEAPAEAPAEVPGSKPTDQASPLLGRTGRPWAEVAIFLIAIAAYVALFEPLGFVLATAGFLAGMVWYLGYHRHWVTGVVSVSVPLVLYLIMTVGLDVVLPAGPLPF
ncbi:tripartite tricarboxylate transporter TctB family protein [Nocardioides limicola]|uniref:tripartite tricarboxylate transporter TctB family protein n=1 Tax=Nocardioides limicola TaxID=2803368 RepID=UPI00193BF14F|nr:tripartite tricarboxylate transporter TctB family protein [Nocardioides sp. DJM-14]